MKFILLIVTVFCVLGCAKNTPVNNNLESPDTESATQEEEKPSIEKPRTGVALEVLREDCFKVANEANLSTEQAEAICLNANPHSQNCLEQGLEVSVLRSDIAVICANAREGSTTCIRDARIKDQKFSEEIADLCR